MSKKFSMKKESPDVTQGFEISIRYLIPPSFDTYVPSKYAIRELFLLW
jgi:hypothetical protein